GQAGTNMTVTGWYNVVSLGARDGAFNADFSDGAGAPAGDPYGSLAWLSIVVPNRINYGRSLPEVKNLADGLKMPTYDVSGSPAGVIFTANPAWILLDILRRCGWQREEIDLASFSRSATFCDEQIQTQDLYGNSVMTPRFQCNLVLQKRRSAGDVLR